MSKTKDNKRRFARDYTLHLSDSDWRIIRRALEDWDFPQPGDPCDERWFAFDRLRDESRRACMPYIHDPDWNEAMS